MRFVPWRLRALLSYFLDADEGWAIVRLFMTIVVVWCFVIVGRHLEPVNAEGWASGWQTTFPRLKIIPPWLLAYVLSYFKLQAMRHWIVPMSAVALAIAAGMLYVQDIFEFHSFRQVLKYMVASLFGLGYPSLIIRNGQRDLKPDDPPNTIDRIGGPGYLDVKLGNAVVLERGAGPTQVVGAGKHFLRRFEAIREILDLREMYRRSKEVDANTKDGIAITVRDVESTFRLHLGKKQRSEVDPYPFSVWAARVATYDRSVQKNSQLKDWGDGVLGAITGQIGGWVAHQRLDRLTAPTEEEPRVAIRKEFQTTKARSKLKDMGAELIWVNIGHLDTPKEIDDQRAETWQSFWQRQDTVTLAQGRAMGVAYEELGRSEGQADMLQAIASALESAPPEMLDERLAEMILLRIARVLEVMTAEPGLADPRRLRAGRNGSAYGQRALDSKDQH